MTETMDEISESKRNRELNGRTKGNENYQKVITLLTTYAAAIIALPIVFFKDIVKEIPKNSSIINVILEQDIAMSAFFTAIISLSACIIAGMNYINYSGWYIRQLNRKYNPISWLKTEEGVSTISKMQILYNICWISFSLGSVSMIVFILTFKR